MSCKFFAYAAVHTASFTSLPSYYSMSSNSLAVIVVADMMHRECPSYYLEHANVLSVVSLEFSAYFKAFKCSLGQHLQYFLLASVVIGFGKDALRFQAYCLLHQHRCS